MERTEQGIRVTYYYSACVGIATPDVRVLCDPWFTPGIYDGSWFQYPPLVDPLETIGAADVVWISHIHPDHYDPRFLAEYLRAHPRARVLIAPFAPNYLATKMRADGIPHEVVRGDSVGDTTLRIVLCCEGDPSSLDSALAVRWKDRAVVNLNDNRQSDEQISALRAFCESGVDIALLPYGGAGAWPQTYVEDADRLELAAETKRRSYLDQFTSLIEALEPRLAIPFAGQYVLGGKLHGLNQHRGVADAVEAAALHPAAVVLADGGRASVDTETLEPTAVRTEPYPAEELEAFARSLADRPMDWERWFGGLPLEVIPFGRILPRCYENALARSRCERDWYLCLRLPGGRGPGSSHSSATRWFACNANRDARASSFTESVEGLWPRSELLVDPHYLFGLATGVFHWNNAEIGSQYRTRRFPDEYSKEVQAFLNFFHL